MRKLLESSCKTLELSQQKNIDAKIVHNETTALVKRNYELSATLNESYLNLVFLLTKDNIIFSLRKLKKCENIC